MANLIRSAKSGNDWRGNDLLAFNIKVVDVGIDQFFGVQNLPPVPESVPHTILNSPFKPDEPPDHKSRQFFKFLRLAENASPEESHVGDFAAFILRLLKYDDVDWEDRIVTLRMLLSFIMDGDEVDIQTDVCVVGDSDSILLLIQEGKRTSDPEPQVIAASLAAFHTNNLRRMLNGRQELESESIPAIAMVGTTPYFYLVPVATALARAVATASFPAEETTVFRFVPPVPTPTNGFRPLENRRVMFQCLEAFKAFVNQNAQRNA